VNESGEILRGLQIFNVPVGEERYVTEVLMEKARHHGMWEGNATICRRSRGGVSTRVVDHVSVLNAA
jgi:hypothetical protein